MPAKFKPCHDGPGRDTIVACVYNMQKVAYHTSIIRNQLERKQYVSYYITTTSSTAIPAVCPSTTASERTGHGNWSG